MGESDLISRLQAATGPSRELDAQIALANGWRNTRLLTGALKPCWHDAEGRIVAELPCFTESIDAALTLVPKAAEYQHGSAKLIGKFWASVIMPEMEYKATAPTPALALLIAIMLAKGECWRRETS
jgi:hypothetical protein